MSSTMSAKRSRGVRVLGLAFATLFVLLCLAALLVYLGWHGQPPHWVQEQQRLADIPEVQHQAISESIRNRLLTQWSDPGEKTPLTEADLFGHKQEIKIPYTDLNTWIKAEGVELLTDIGIEVPETTRSAMIDSPGDGLVRISFEVAVDGIKQIITLSFEVVIANDGTLTSTLERATAGRFPLPIATAIRLVAEQSDGGVLLDLIKGNPLPPIELPIDPSDDGLRDGRLVGLVVTGDALVITRETVRKNTKN